MTTLPTIGGFYLPEFRSAVCERRGDTRFPYKAVHTDVPRRSLV